MKKLLLSVAIFIPFIYSSQVSEDFDSYADGDMLSVAGASNGWGEWSGGSGTTESCSVSSVYSVSGANSGKSMGGNNGLWTWTDFTTGTVTFSMNILVPAGSEGGTIALGDAEMNDQPHSINLLGDDQIIAIDYATQSIIGSATITPEMWINVSLIIDMDNATSEFIIDGNSVGISTTSFGPSNVGFGGINFWGTSFNPFTGVQTSGEYYFDDLFVTDPSAGIVEGSSISLNIAPNPSNGKFAIDFNDSFDDAVMTITNMMGSVVYSEALSSVSNSTQNFDLDLNSGVYLVKVSDDSNEFTTRVVIK